MIFSYQFISRSRNRVVVEPVLEHLESCSTKIFMNGPMTQELCKGEKMRKIDSYILRQEQKRKNIVKEERKHDCTHVNHNKLDVHLPLKSYTLISTHAMHL